MVKSCRERAVHLKAPSRAKRPNAPADECRSYSGEQGYSNVSGFVGCLTHKQPERRSSVLAVSSPGEGPADPTAFDGSGLSAAFEIGRELGADVGH